MARQIHTSLPSKRQPSKTCTLNFRGSFFLSPVLIAFCVFSGGTLHDHQITFMTRILPASFSSVVRVVWVVKVARVVRAVIIIMLQLKNLKPTSFDLLERFQIIFQRILFVSTSRQLQVLENFLTFGHSDIPANFPHCEDRLGG